MYRKSMHRSQRVETCLKHEMLEDQFSLYGPSIQILHSNSGNILFKVSFGIWLVNVSLSTELLSVSVSWGNWAYAIASYVFTSACLCPSSVIFEPLGQNQAKFVRKRDISLTITYLHILRKGAPRKKPEAIGASHLWEKQCLLTHY